MYLNPQADSPARNGMETIEAPQGRGPGATILDLPPEVVVQVYHLLRMTDRLSLIRTSRVFKDIYTESSTLQYDFALRTSAYLDVAFEHPPTSSSGSEAISIEPNHKTTNDQIRGRSSARSGPSALSSNPDTQSHPSVTFPLSFDPPLSERQHKHSKRALGAAEKADKLKAREKRWSTLDNVAERQFTVRGRAGVYELQEGVFLMCGDYMEGEVMPSTVRLIPLPSANDPDLDNPPIPLKSARLPFPIADLTMDPTQDLIVISEHRPASADPSQPMPTHRYHLLTLSTFTPHPLASLPTLDFPPYQHPVMSSRQLLQVMGDVLVISVSRYIAAWLMQGLGMGMPMASRGIEEEVVCWNWKTGRVLARMALPENGWFSSFALLTPTTFMITSTSNISQVMHTEQRTIASVFPPVIQIYSFASDPANPITPVQPLSDEFQDDTTPRPVLLAQLDLPRFAPGATVDTFDVRPDPAFPPRVPGPGGESSGPRIGGSKPFTQDPTKGVLVFELKLVEPTEGIEGITEEPDTVPYELFVLRETLVRLAEEGEKRLKVARESPGPDGFERWMVEEMIKWDDWGLKSARLMDTSMAKRYWVCSCSGYRFISLIPSDDLPSFSAPEHNSMAPGPPRRSDLRLFDFSPYSVRREISRSTKLNAPWDKLQDIPTSSAPVSLSDENIHALLQDEIKDFSSTFDDRDPSHRERVYERFRRQYDRMFYAASDRARSDRADRERGRGRAGGNRSDSQSRSRSRSQHQLSGRHHRPAHGSHSRPRFRESAETPSPGPGRASSSRASLSGPSGSGTAFAGERRSRSRSARSVSPTSIFHRVAQPINMAGPDVEEIIDEDGIPDEEDEYEVRVVTAPTVLEKRRVWRDDVITGLPFVEIWRRKEMRANGVMMDDQRVIVVCTEGKRQPGLDDEAQTLTVLCM